MKDVSLAVNRVRSDETKGVEYMTLQQKIYDERLEGREEGEKRLATLLQKMMEDQLDSEIPKVLQDDAFKKEMFEKYNL